MKVYVSLFFTENNRNRITYLLEVSELNTSILSINRSETAGRSVYSLITGVVNVFSDFQKVKIKKKKN